MGIENRAHISCDCCGIEQAVDTLDEAAAIEQANYQGKLGWVRLHNWIFCGNCHKAYNMELMDRQQKEYERFMGRTMLNYPVSRIW